MEAGTRRGKGVVGNHKVVSDGVEGVHVDFDGECHHERGK